MYKVTAILSRWHVYVNINIPYITNLYVKSPALTFAVMPQIPFIWNCKSSKLFIYFSLANVFKPSTANITRICLHCSLYLLLTVSPHFSLIMLFVLCCTMFAESFSRCSDQMIPLGSIKLHPKHCHSL